MNKRRQGAEAEAVAARFLEQAGYTILERNYRGPAGEIDLVASKGQVLVFVEVKMRTSRDFGHPAEAVTPKKQRRIIETAKHYLTGHGRSGWDVRFDVIAMLGSGPEAEIQHIENAFSLGDETEPFSTGSGVMDSGAAAIDQRNVVFKNYNIAYYQLGEGPLTCLFLHGLPTNGLLWRNIMPQIAEAGYNCVAPDQFGLGQSEGPPEGRYSIAEQAKLLKLVVDRLRLGRLILIGHDTGGGVAQVYLARWSQNVEAVVLTNSVGLDAWPVPVVRRLQRALRFGFGRWLLHPKWGRRLAGSRWGFPAGLSNPENFTEGMLERYIDPLLRSPSRREQFKRYLLDADSRHTRHVGPTLSYFKRPVLVAWATGDRLLPRSLGRRLSELFPNSTYRELPHGAHYHLEEQPQQFTDTLLEFLKSL